MGAAAVVKAFPSDRRERFRGRWQPEGLTEEVVLVEGSTLTSDTAGGRPAYLPLLPRLRQGKAFGCASSYF